MPAAVAAAPALPADEPGGDPEVGESVDARPVTEAASPEAARSLPDFERGGRTIITFVIGSIDGCGTIVAGVTRIVRQNFSIGKRYAKRSAEEERVLARKTSARRFYGKR